MGLIRDFPPYNKGIPHIPAAIGLYMLVASAVVMGGVRATLLRITRVGSSEELLSTRDAQNDSELTFAKT